MLGSIPSLKCRAGNSYQTSFEEVKRKYIQLHSPATRHQITSNSNKLKFTFTLFSGVEVSIPVAWRCLQGRPPLPSHQAAQLRRRLSQRKWRHWRERSTWQSWCRQAVARLPVDRPVEGATRRRHWRLLLWRHMSRRKYHRQL